MKFSFRSFGIGFGCAALSLGAATYANAASNGTLKACANKTTGAMRYISKGACKKTETLLSWGQLGPQGLPGTAGVAGTNGTAGAKGESGIAGSSGTKGADGTKGQNLFLVNKDGSDVGPITRVTSYGATVLFNDFLWNIDLANGSIFSDPSWFYLDSVCSSPTASLYGTSYIGAPAPSQLVFIDIGLNRIFETTDKAYRFTGFGSTAASYSRLFRRGTGDVCQELTTLEKTQYDNSYKVAIFNVVEVLTRPSINLPLTVVAK